jgi:hypothetical protein
LTSPGASLRFIKNGLDQGKRDFGLGLFSFNKEKAEAPIIAETSVPEVAEIFKEIQAQPEKLFKMIRVDVRALLNGSIRGLKAEQKPWRSS